MPADTVNGSNGVELINLSTDASGSQPAAGALPGNPQSTRTSTQPVLVFDGITITHGMTTEQKLDAMGKCLERAEKMGRTMKNVANGFFDPETKRWKTATLFLALWGIIVPTLMAFYFGGSANDIAMRSLRATEWSNYWNWATQICPAEQVRVPLTP